MNVRTQSVQRMADANRAASIWQSCKYTTAGACLSDRKVHSTRAQVRDQGVEFLQSRRRSLATCLISEGCVRVQPLQSQMRQGTNALNDRHRFVNRDPQPTEADIDLDVNRNSVVRASSECLRALEAGYGGDQARGGEQGQFLWWCGRE